MYISVFAHTYISVSVLVRPGGYRGQQFPGLGARVEEVFRLQLNGYELRRSIVTNVREYPRLGIFGIGLCVCVPCSGTECLKALDGFIIYEDFWELELTKFSSLSLLTS